MTSTLPTSALLPRNLRREYPLAVRGEGCYLWDAAGRKYLDACGGSAVVTIGHGVREIADAMQAQAAQLAYTHSSQFHTPLAEELASLLAAQFPRASGATQQARVFFTSGGSEATETALKLARLYWLRRGEPQRARIISRRISYHGATLGALGVSGNELRRAAFAPLMPSIADQPLIAPCFCYRCPFDLKFPECKVGCADDLERAIAECEAQSGAGSVAGFIFEPVVGASSGAVPPEGYVARIREICDARGILLIADEVMCGAGRTGKYFALEHWNAAADMVLLGKGLASGYAPLGAVLVAERVWRTLAEGAGTLDHGFTYSAHAVSLAAGLAVQRYVAQHDLIARARTAGAELAAALESLRQFDCVGDVRGLGLLQSVEFVADHATRAPFPAEAQFSQRVFEAMRQRGVLVYPMRGAALGSAPGAGDCPGDHILIAPPFTITRQHIEELRGALHETLTELR